MSALDAMALIRECSNCQRSDLQANPSLADNQYVKRVFGVMTKNEMGEVTFDVFVRTAGVQAPIPSHFDFQHVTNRFLHAEYASAPASCLARGTAHRYCTCAAVFRPDKPIATKLQFIFNLFDYNMDDTLDPEELAEMISIVCTLESKPSPSPPST